MTTSYVPERNKRVKKLLQAEFPGINISVTAGNGTAYHWIYITFPRRPDPMPKFPEGVKSFDDYIANLIVKAGIKISTFPRDDAGRPFGELPCINVRLPHEARTITRARK